MKLYVEKLNLEFSGKEILNDISFSIQEGEFVSILGPSGCGKSTILNVLAGLIEDYSGSVFVDDEPITGISSHFAYMPQSDLLLEWRTILDNVCLYGEINHDKSIRQRALKEFETFGISGYENAYPSSLSGGMRQRAALIRTLALKPELLLLDEPFSALDSQTRLSVSDDIGKILRQEKKTAILVTHDISEAISMADRVIILSPRPAIIRKIVPVCFDLENRTPMASRNAPEFKSYFNLIWKELNHDV